LNVTPGNKSVICCGTGQGEVLNGDVFDFGNPPTSLVGNIRNNTLNIRCKVDDECFFLGGMTSTGTVACNTVNIYDVGSCSEVKVFGGRVFCSDCAENNTLNIYKGFSGKSVWGGVVRISTSTFNTINIFSNLNILEGIYGGEVSRNGISWWTC
jgi:hypothetical protein